MAMQKVTSNWRRWGVASCFGQQLVFRWPPPNRISSRVATVLSNQSYGDDYGIERFLTGFHLILVRLVSMGDVLRHVATKVLEPRLFRLQSFRRRKSLSWNCWNFCMLGDLWSLFACHFGSTAWGFRCFKVVGGETAELRTPCASWGSGLLWFTHQTVQIASTRSLPKSVRSQKRYARMKEFKRFCNFFFINKVIQVILVYTWICLSLPNGHIRATKMNIYILELGYPIFRPTYVCHCQNNSKHG